MNCTCGCHGNNDPTLAACDACCAVAPAPVTPPLTRDGIGTKDGVGSQDNDKPYTFGMKPDMRSPWPFTEREYSRLLRKRDLELGKRVAG